MKKCVVAQGFSLGGKLINGGRWWHVQTAIAGIATIVVSAWLKRGDCVRTWELAKYSGEAIILISLRSRHTKGFVISQVVNTYGAARGGSSTMRSSVKRRIYRI